MITKRTVILLFFIVVILPLSAQNNGLFDSALSSKKIDKIIGIWYYGNKEKDTLAIRITRIIDRKSLPGASEGLPKVHVWVYYKKKGSIIKDEIKKYKKNQYPDDSRTMSGVYLDYVDAVVLTYKDANFSWLSKVKLTLKKKKLFWEVRHKLEEENKRHNFFYPEKLVLRRMKKKLL
jgi:hypothetical protein